eukprot:SAG11_NODE_259_length_11534_cov_3.402361_3_plen_79_part_00
MASAGVAADVEAEVEDEDDVNEIVSASSGLQARLWNYLLDNLNRAVGEIHNSHTHTNHHNFSFHLGKDYARAYGMAFR